MRRSRGNPKKTHDTPESVVDHVYGRVRAKAVEYEFRPGARLNEVALARELGVSRTPLREALNRLTSEGFLRLIGGRGFFFRELDPKEIYDLYEFRRFLECGAASRAVERATKDQIDALGRFLDDTAFDPTEHDVAELVRLDEIFHERLVQMSGNLEMCKVLANINARIRFIRWIDVCELGDRTTHREHRAILRALRRQDASCVQLLEKHISKRPEEILRAIKQRAAELYVGGGAVLA